MFSQPGTYLSTVCSHPGVLTSYSSSGVAGLVCIVPVMKTNKNAELHILFYCCLEDNYSEFIKVFIDESTDPDSVKAS